MYAETILWEIGIPVEMLQALSPESALGISLKHSLGHVEESALMSELEHILDTLNGQESVIPSSLDYRVKSMASVVRKYHRYYPNKPIGKTFNDLLGFRALCDSYDGVLEIGKEPHFRLADMSQGKAQNDGYCGVHVYFQPDNFHYPIEIQFNTYWDRQLNDWLHIAVYKQNYPRLGWSGHPQPV